MRNVETRFMDHLLPEHENVNVDLARSPAESRGAAKRAFDILCDFQKAARVTCPGRFDNLVQETRLILDAPRVCLSDFALAHNRHAARTQLGARFLQVALSVADVAPQAEVHAPGAHRIASATRTTCVISATSWTRTMSAPLSTAPETVAAVPLSRSAGEAVSSSLPIKDFLEVPTSTG